MYDTQMRMRRLEQAVQLRQRRKQARKISTLGLVSCVLGLVELGLLTEFNRGTLDYGESGYMYGASMLSNDVGGYVLVGVIAFVVAVVFTLFCIKHGKK